MVKLKKRASLEDSINKTNPITLVREFLGGVYSIIDDLLTIYVSVYNVLDKLTDNTVCNVTIPQILKNICDLEEQIDSMLMVFRELPNIIANSPELSFISGHIKIINTVVKSLFGTLDLLKDKLFRDIGIPVNVDICNEGTLLTNKICVHLQKASDNKILLFIKKVGRVLVIFKKWFTTLEPFFRLEKLSIKDIFYSGKSLTDNLTPEIGEISAELNREVDNLKKDIKNTKLQGAQIGGAYNKYNFILDPDTKEIYYLNSPKGIKLLKKYKTLVNL
tara:strand:+ start:5334 stop:6161 length:828 start_codon:yes stop_codon:yes gene_type:complete